MKRDMDLIRAILLKVESCDDPTGLDEQIEIDGYNQDQISYHIKILDEAGLLKATDVSSLSSFGWWPGNLTWHGQEFLSAAKDDTLWNKAKEKFMKPTMSFTVDLLFEYLKMKTMEKLGQ